MIETFEAEAQRLITEYEHETEIIKAQTEMLASITRGIETMGVGFPEYSSNGLCDLIRDAFKELAKRRYDYAMALQQYELAAILSDEKKLREPLELATKQEADPYNPINGGIGETR